VQLDDLTRDSSINIENLKPALSVINKWEEDLFQTDSDENKEYAEFLLGEAVKSQNTTSSYIPKFSKRLMNTVVESVAFPYPHLLPTIPFRMDLRKKIGFIPIEDYLIAHFLEIFYDEYRNERIRNDTEVKVSLERICSRLCSRMCPFRESDRRNSMYRYVIQRKSKNAVYNPIKYFFEHCKAPPVKHKLYEYNGQLAAKDLPLNSLNRFPKAWADHLKNYKALLHNRITLSRPVQKVVPWCRALEPPNAEAETVEKSRPQPIFLVKAKSDSKCSNVLPLQYEIVEVPGEPDTTARKVIAANSASGNDGSDSRSLELGQKVGLPSTSKAKRRDIENCVSRLHSKNVAKQSETSDPIPKNSITPSSSIRNTLSRKLAQILSCTLENSITFNAENANNHHLLAVQSSVRNFIIYMNLVEFNLKMANINKKSNKEAGDETQNRKSKPVEDVAEPQDSVNPCSSTSAPASTKKNPKTQRTDNTRLMLLPETREDTNEKDLVYAQNFMDKVEEVYLAENKSEKITEFLHILQTFNESTDKVEEMYYKMEKLFLPDHPELADLFLTFMLPGHAAVVGKFMEHFMLTNMNNFINKLNIYFNKQPAQIRKIMACLKDLSNEDDVKMEQIKLKICPLLKGNPLLIEWFKQCFPDETSSDNSPDDYESLSFHKAENANQTDDENDVYENIQQNEIIADPVENPCLLRYLNGRMYYGSSRVLLPAKLSFLVVTASDQKCINKIAKCEVTQRQKDGIGENETEYRCVHNIKQFGDNKIKECQKNQLETSDISVSEDVDNEKSTEEQNCSDATDDVDVQSSESCVNSDEKNTAESQEIVYNTCDDLTLKAHGIRLNPTVHQSNVIKSEDLLCLLDPVDDIACKDAEESQKNSPKRQSTRAHRKSPNTKKTTKRSSIGNRKTSNATEDSNAIRTAKRLKRLIESDDLDEPERLSKKPKLSKQTKVAENGKIRKNRPSSSDETTAIEIVKTEPNAKTVTSASSTPDASNTWSREEDKLVLEQIKMGFTNEENLVQTLHLEKLPNRTHDEIYDRFKFLMD
ncbi:GON-4-like protein, partial [Pseudolycoriella hygida]